MVKIFVEGGGQTADIQQKCRKGFHEFLAKAGVCKRPRIVASGSRQEAYKDYCTAVRNGEDAFLLVDSEGPVDPAHQNGNSTDWIPWAHLGKQEGWEKPARVDEDACHLMVRCMENWFLADRETLRTYFGQGFLEGALPAASRPLESIPKPDVLAALKKATVHLKTKAPYDKGAHSFALLGRVDPVRILENSPWARRFVDALRNHPS
ncbi:DUF4276 family protein [Pararhodospirillum oryzae]|uniref:DUF4276 domain-containing protein n=1 Tax=Pararhodospirillum oryzae TaxID=478448 RepID=A0A512H9M8_9PROT|nr:DUF4276 family protein [Pararhodospirillum oryzae]GEO82142.1 hypothetical protein ROR02_22730 [Pararhodospirillum oryzae]